MNKPDSVPLAGPIIHLSNQPGTYRHLAVPIRRAAGPVPYLILLRGGFTLRGDSHRSAGGLLPHHFTITRRRKPRKNGLSFSVALSIAGNHFRHPALDERVLCPLESGLSSANRQRPVTRTSLQEKFSKIFSAAKIKRDRGCVRT